MCNHDTCKTCVHWLYCSHHRRHRGFPCALYLSKGQEHREREQYEKLFAEYLEMHAEFKAEGERGFTADFTNAMARGQFQHDFKRKHPCVDRLNPNLNDDPVISLLVHGF